MKVQIHDNPGKTDWNCWTFVRRSAKVSNLVWSDNAIVLDVLIYLRKQWLWFGISKVIIQHKHGLKNRNWLCPKTMIISIWCKPNNGFHFKKLESHLILLSVLGIKNEYNCRIH